MKFALIFAPLLAGLLAAVGTAVLIGALLPKGHRATLSLVTEASPERIWGLISDFEHHPKWRRQLAGIERQADQDGKPVWKEIRSDGWGLPLRVEESIAPKRQVTRIADPKAPFGGTWTFEIDREGAMTRIRITEDGEVYNPAFRFMSKFMDQSATIREYLRALAAELGGTERIEA